MLFNSPEFITLFVLTFSIYYIPFLSHLQVPLLVVASLVFYAFAQPYLLILLLLSIFFNAWVSFVLIQKQDRAAKFQATMGIVTNLLVIIFFKYSGMLSTSFGVAETGIGVFLVTLPLPLGISFFTFEGISLLVDVYKGRKFEENEIIEKSFTKHTLKTLLFVSFFPHLIAGPILKAKEFYPQIIIKNWAAINWNKAFRQLTIGYFLKIVIADNLKDYTLWISYPYFINLSTLSLSTMLFGYSIQIFADFAGYSLIALGLATLLGYELKGNFNFPYISSSFAEFWQRWHISLSSFLREYLYIPLGGNRKGKARTYINLFATMFLGGLWHGAAWSYAIWGIAHGIFLALERFIKDNLNFQAKVGFLGGAVVFTGVTFAWLFFKLPDFKHAFIYINHVFANGNFNSDFDQLKRASSILVYSFPVIVYHFHYLLTNHYTCKIPDFIEYSCFGLMLFLIVVNSGSSTEFIYFQF